MSGPQKVQVYLERHKVGALFEELMGKVIADMPDEPVIYLIRALNRKATRMGLSTDSILTRKSTDHDSMAVPKDKSWQSSSKKPSSGHPARKSGGKPEWNSDKKVKTNELDDLWGSKGEGHVKTRARSPSPGARRLGVKGGWSDKAGGDEEMLFTSLGYSGPRHRNVTDPLEDELISVKETTTTREDHTPTKAVSTKRNDYRANSERHRQELESLILQRKRAEDSGIEDDRDLHTDDAIEIRENLDDLRNEGANVKSSGGTSVRNTACVRNASPEPQVRVSICARCAKVMNGEPSPFARPVDRYAQQSDVTPAFPQNRTQSVRFMEQDSEDEFESVSQVTGPRKPVWQDDSDDDSVTPRKGKHMFASTVPAKGKSKFGADTAQSQDFRHSSASNRAYTKDTTSALHQTWSPDTRLGFSSSDPNKSAQRQMEGATNEVLKNCFTL